VKHIGIDPAYGEPPVIDPAPAIFQEPAGSIIILLNPQSIARDIIDSMLIAEFRFRGRFECLGFYLTDYFHISVKKKDMAVKCPGTAF